MRETQNTEKNQKNTQNRKLSLLQKQLVIIGAIVLIFISVTTAIWQVFKEENEGYFEFWYGIITGTRDDVAEEETSDGPKYDEDGDLLGIQDRPYIYDVIPMEKVSTVEISNVDPESGEKRNFSFYMDPVANSLILAGREMLSFDKEKLSYLYVNTCNMLTMMKVENPSEDLSQYGLADGVSDTWFRVTTVDGETKQVYIGDKLPTGAAYYCKSVDKPHIYVIDTMIEQCVLASPDDFIVPMICPPIAQEKIYTVDNIKLVSEGELKVMLNILPGSEINENDGVSFSHIMTYPGGYTVSQAEVDNILLRLSSFVGSKVEQSDLFGSYRVSGEENATESETEDVTEDTTEGGAETAEQENAADESGEAVTEENGGEDAELSEADRILKATLERYGLTKPSHEIHYTVDGKEYKIIFGAKTEDGSGYYAMNMTQLTICVVPVADVPFLEYELIDFVDEYIFQMSIDNLESIEVGTRKSKEKFLLSGKGPELRVEKESDGAVVDTKTFRQFYIDLLLVTMTGKADTPDTSDEVLSYIFTTRDNRKYEYRFYDISTTKVFYTVNGVGEFYVNRDSVNKVINDFDMLMAGETFMSEALGG